MNTDKFYLDPTQDTEVAWARRKETTLATLKMFRMTLDAVRRHSEWIETRHGISAVELWALWELAQTPGMRAVDLSKAMAMSRGNTETLLESLGQRGLVRLAGDPGNPASGAYVVTYDGQRIADASPQFGQGVLKAAMTNLPDASLLKLAEAMSDLVQNLPFLEQSAALQPMADLLRPGGSPKRVGSDKPMLNKVL
jgi:DNA-binding MarR family transcriptional regulator